MTLTDIIENVTAEIADATVNRAHPFRNFFVATISPKNTIRQRTVVLRDFIDGHKVFFYTDSRSAKLDDLSHHPQVSLLFYDRPNKLQVICDGLANVKSFHALPQKVINQTSTNDYSSIPAPGCKISGPQKIVYDSQGIYFTVVEIKIEILEYLKLDRKGHVRARFERKGANWQGTFLAP